MRASSLRRSTRLTWSAICSGPGGGLRSRQLKICRTCGGVFKLKILTFPLTIITFGFFLIVINAIMLKMAASVTPGFIVHTWTAALIGAIVLSLVSTFLHWLIKDNRPVETRRY